MPRVEIVASECYPMFELWPENDHWAESKYFEHIVWSDVPQEIIDEHRAAKQKWVASQEAIRKIWEAHE